MVKQSKFESMLCAIIAFFVATLLTYRAFRHPEKDVIMQLTKAIISKA